MPESETTCIQRLEATCDVRVLGIGSIVEKEVVSNLRRSYVDLTEVVERWTEQKASLNQSELTLPGTIPSASASPALPTSQAARVQQASLPSCDSTDSLPARNTMGSRRTLYFDAVEIVADDSKVDVEANTETEATETRGVSTIEDLGEQVDFLLRKLQAQEQQQQQQQQEIEALKAVIAELKQQPKDAKSKKGNVGWMKRKFKSAKKACSGIVTRICGV
eukprot:Colp12_sorted_trinity150504_noHs@11188